MGSFLQVWFGGKMKQKLQSGLEQEIEAKRIFNISQFLSLVDKWQSRDCFTVENIIEAVLRKDRL